MASIKFRFATECEMTLHGDSYEDIYLQFKDFVHGNQSVAHGAFLTVFPPESVQLFFNLDSSEDAHEIPLFKGDFQQDIAKHCTASELNNIQQREPAQAIWGSGWYPEH